MPRILHPISKAFSLIKLFIMLIIILMCINLFAMFSITGGVFDHLVSKQMIIFFLSFIVVIVFSIININFVFSNTYCIYIFILLSLIMTIVFGHKAMGAKRWINLGLLHIQPSEFMKISVILALSKFFHNCHISDVNKYQYLVFPIFLVLLPTIIILKQPNLGTSLIIILTSINIFFVSGVKIKLFICLVISGILSFPVIWRFLYEYQKTRILTFLDPTTDTLGAGYSIIQSIISIGSGGLWGKGFLKGSQNQLDFLPENHTDFIFALIAEEGGFILCLLIFIIYSLLILVLYLIAMQCYSQYYRIFISGFASLLFFHVLINISMISGLMPVVGVPLPLLSYGGSNYLSMMIGIGLTLNIVCHKNQVSLQSSNNYKFKNIRLSI